MLPHPSWGLGLLTAGGRGQGQGQGQQREGEKEGGRRTHVGRLHRFPCRTDRGRCGSRAGQLGPSLPAPAMLPSSRAHHQLQASEYRAPCEGGLAGVPLSEGGLARVPLSERGLGGVPGVREAWPTAVFSVAMLLQAWAGCVRSLL